MLTPDHPQNCVLLEWNKNQQQFYFNDVVDGKPRRIPYSFGWEPVGVCANDDEGLRLIECVEDYIDGHCSAYTDYSCSHVRHYIAVIISIDKMLRDLNIKGLLATKATW